tara:strand:- start:149 stop:469 length:321 start_codon:yes stop_codon:yes gene_type:complete
MQPIRIKWNSAPVALDNGTLTTGTEGVMVGPGLAAWPSITNTLYSVPLSNCEVLSSDLGGWDGTTVTPDLILALLSHPDAIAVLVQTMNAHPELGTKVVQGVMAGL